MLNCFLNCMLFTSWQPASTWAFVTSQQPLTRVDSPSSHDEFCINAAVSHQLDMKVSLVTWWDDSRWKRGNHSVWFRKNQHCQQGKQDYSLRGLKHLDISQTTQNTYFPHSKTLLNAIVSSKTPYNPECHNIPGCVYWCWSYSQRYTSIKMFVFLRVAKNYRCYC